MSKHRVSSAIYVKSCLLITFCCFLSSCSATDPEAVAKINRNSALKLAALFQQYGEINTPKSRAYLSGVAARLQHVLKEEQQVLVKILNSSEALAFAPDHRYLLISRALIKRLNDEAELAFILAHELAHIKLNHLNDPEYLSCRYQSFCAKELEFAADRYALGIIAMAGYNPYAAINALTHAYHASSIYKSRSTTHPTLERRIFAVKNAIRASGWHPPGINNRRAYHQFKSQL